jgi:hypothetical protein
MDRLGYATAQPSPAAELTFTSGGFLPSTEKLLKAREVPEALASGNDMSWPGYSITSAARGLPSRANGG